MIFVAKVAVLPNATFDLTFPARPTFSEIFQKLAAVYDGMAPIQLDSFHVVVRIHERPGDAASCKTPLTRLPVCREGQLSLHSCLEQRDP